MENGTKLKKKYKNINQNENELKSGLKKWVENVFILKKKLAIGTKFKNEKCLQI